MRFIFGMFLLLVVSAISPVTKPKPKNRIILSEPSETEKFMSHMARRESNNNHRVVNRFGMMGRYQFSPNTVRVLGFKVDKNTFLSNPHLQDSVMLAYMRANGRELYDIISRYEGRRYRGVMVTRAGVLAGAHLCGSGNVRRFFTDPEHIGCIDANGTSITHYMTEFNSYKLGESF